MLRRESETGRDKRGFCRRREAGLLSARWSELIKYLLKVMEGHALSHMLPYLHEEIKTSKLDVDGLLSLV